VGGINVTHARLWAPFWNNMAERIKVIEGCDAIERASEFINERELMTNERFVKVKYENFKLPGTCNTVFVI